MRALRLVSTGLGALAVVAALAPAASAQYPEDPARDYIGTRRVRTDTTNTSPKGFAVVDREFSVEPIEEPWGCAAADYVKSHHERQWRSFRTNVRPWYPIGGPAPASLLPNGLFPECKPPLYESGHALERVTPDDLRARREALVPTLEELLAEVPYPLTADDAAIARESVVLALYRLSDAGVVGPFDELCLDPTRDDAIVLIGRRYQLFEIRSDGYAKVRFRELSRADCAELGAEPILETLPEGFLAVDCPAQVFDIDEIVAEIRAFGQREYDNEVRDEDLARVNMDVIHHLVNKANHCELPPIQACLQRDLTDYIIVNGYGIYVTGSTTLEGPTRARMLVTQMVDYDEDGVPNRSDNCPCTVNPLQMNIDGDSYGDACDPSIVPSDAPVTISQNVFWPDGCGGGPPACCELFPPPDNCDERWESAGAPSCWVPECNASCAPIGRRERDSDPDGDGLGACADNCQRVFNPSQADNDGDRMGAACDCDDFIGDPRTLIPGARGDGLPTLQTRALAQPQRGAVCGDTSGNPFIEGLEYHLNTPPRLSAPSVLGGSQIHESEFGGRGLATTFRLDATQIGWKNAGDERPVHLWTPNPPMMWVPNGCAADCIDPCTGERVDWFLAFLTREDRPTDLNGVLPAGLIEVPGKTEGGFCR